ncbi:DUF2254 family protein [Sphingomonas sp. MMS24-JH45]
MPPQPFGVRLRSGRGAALQDLRFLIDELVEIAARALSPGVNDPFTANSCLDWLGAAMSDLARRDLPSRLRAGAARCGSSRIRCASASSTVRSAPSAQSPARI